MELLDRICRNLGVPIAEQKKKGPSTCLVFLDIELDTEDFILRLTQDKILRLRTLLADWNGWK